MWYNVYYTVLVVEYTVYIVLGILTVMYKLYSVQCKVTVQFKCSLGHLYPVAQVVIAGISEPSDCPAPGTSLHTVL